MQRHSALDNQEAVLVSDLFSNYNPDVKATRHSADQVTVSFTFILSKFGGLVSALTMAVCAFIL